MGYAIQWLRSLIFNLLMYVIMPIYAVIFFPFALLSPKGAHFACHFYTVTILWMARWMLGLRTEIRGEVPTGEVLVAAKHQSFFDIIIIFNALPAAKFIMKSELLFAPILGQYAWRLGCVPVNRGKKGQAIEKMVNDVKAGLQRPGQLVIYPQGTRVAPGSQKPYKVGTAVLYQQLQQPCVPVATNAGIFWPKRGVYRKPGLAVVEFLPTIPVGMSNNELVEELESSIESASNELMREAGFEV